MGGDFVSLTTINHFDVFFFVMVKTTLVSSLPNREVSVMHAGQTAHVAKGSPRMGLVVPTKFNVKDIVLHMILTHRFAKGSKRMVPPVQTGRSLEDFVNHMDVEGGSAPVGDAVEFAPFATQMVTKRTSSGLVSGLPAKN